MNDRILGTSPREHGIRQTQSDDSLVDSLIQWEGFLSKPTDIGDGKTTIGSGLTDPKWLELYRLRGNVWSREDNRRAVAQEVAKRRAWAEKNVPNWNMLPHGAQQAMLSYKYNYDFNNINSPKMYEAMEKKDFREAIRQMDATSDNPQFKKGLEIRRAKEQAMGNTALDNSNYQSPTHKTRLSTYPPIVQATLKLINAGKDSAGIPHGVSGRWAEGGALKTSPWDNLSLTDKAAMMKAAIDQGIYDLPIIKAKYNEFAEGGDISDEEYNSVMRRVAEENNSTWNKQREEEGTAPLTIEEDYARLLNDSDYDYRGFYNKYPESAVNADSHWPDEFKTVYHPTFSNESIYHNKIDAKHNPIGLPGGFWAGETFIPQAWQLLEQSRQYKSGGYKPSEAIKKRIAKWEGRAMTGAIDPLSGKWAKNNSFENEAAGFYRALPASIRDQVLSNQDLADNLYSYSYNVGSGNFRKRVVPTLEKYYKGQASVEDIQKSMWASGDKKLRGLRRRRAQERAGVGRALGVNTPIIFDDSPSVTNTPSIYASPTKPTIEVTPQQEELPLFMPSNPEAFFGNVPTYQQPVAEPKVPVTPEVVDDPYSEKALAKEERQRVLNNLSLLSSLTSFGKQDNSLYDLFSLINSKSYGEGGGIHIKPSHRGRLTELKKRTGKTEAELYRTGSPATRKMITFARSARKWKHDDGGYLFAPGGHLFADPDTVLPWQLKK